jgi:hypothetical protein
VAGPANGLAQAQEELGRMKTRSTKLDGALLLDLVLGNITDGVFAVDSGFKINLT